MLHSSASNAYYTHEPRPEERRVLVPFEYKCLHLYTKGEVFTKVVYTGNRAMFLALLAEWNQSPDWKYWEETP